MTRRIGTLLPLLGLLLGGCQAVGHDPLTQPAADMPASCTWLRDAGVSREAWVRAAIPELEARGFTVRSTDLELGVVSAERTRRQPGMGAIDEPWFAGTSLWSSFGRRSAVGVGYGVHLGDDPVQVERLSLVVGEDSVSLTRDSSVIDTDGYVVDARPYNRDAFCREVSGAIESRLINTGARP
ncbi:MULTISPECIES: hypothetical protein [unclassified Modicisalibacter]|uniref:hypothetical protein n=1 Tax=unclassified Modicisalibacter TaxID=2679913 RepID=UPI001CC9A5A8|nr:MULTISPECIES: hypothetical protein [unclassified Modicisalibacter]MBZ9559177.1 hypothetical protein [Modicisalibacter sp. R2A 31.J]MBZ9576658.1 hypothetical protein [Modicisalibacter sp. MOD 31.J]